MRLRAHSAAIHSALVAVTLLLGCGEARGQQPNGWFKKPDIPRDTITAELDSVWAAAPEQAAIQAKALRAQLASASEEGKLALQLLVAAAHERAGDLAGARTAYDELFSQARETPYGASADFRLRILGQEDQQALEGAYRKVLEQPSARREGWYVVSGRWAWTTADRAANQALAEIRQSQLSFRFFDLLREHSFFPAPYAYLFVLLALTLAIKVLSLPLLIRSAQLAVAMRRLAPEVRAIQETYADDPVTMHRQLQALYQARGVNVLAGCPAAIVDLIFVIWALVALSAYRPRMALDDARFLWIGDVTQYHFSIVLVWLGLCYLHSWLAGTQRQSARVVSQLLAGILFVGGFIWLVAWYWQWPAYVFVFWILLMLSGILITRTLVPILELAQKR
jgi:YidC/Oxa1 family membrane protein insertase